MKIFDILFKKKKTIDESERKDIPKENIDISKEIDDILDILKELGFMDAYSIEKELDRKKIDYDKSILYRLMIDIDEDNISELKRYVSNEKFGYGETKINQIKHELEEKVKECNEQNKSRIEAIEEVIAIAKVYITNYQNKLYEFNNIIKTLKENSNIEAEVIAMIAYWIDYFKDQEFGYPIDLEKKLSEAASELRNLPEGGYGEEKINEFLSSGRKEISEGKNNNLTDSEILQKIVSTLVAQYKNRYLYDLNKLNMRIKTIENSTFIGDEEKQKNITELRIDFNKMYGHNVDIPSSINKMCQTLEQLEYGGYGKTIIEEFKSLANKIVEEVRSVGKEDKTIIAKIEIEYHKLLNEYNRRKEILEEELRSVESSDMTSKEKIEKRKRLKDDFKADSGHKVDLKKKVKEMIESLEKLENGGYGQSIIREFKVECEKILTKAGRDSSDVLQVYKKIESVYDDYISKYKNALKELKTTYSQIDSNMSLNSVEKEATKEEFSVEFELKVGRELNLKSRVEDFIKSLKELPNGGYGKKVIVEFENFCLEIINENKPEKEKYLQINQRVKLLKNRYYNNLKVFEKWKQDRLLEYQGKNKSEYEKELDEKIKYMLSLSQSDLEAYYQEDDRIKKEEFQNHNIEVAVKYLAKKEAEKKKDEKLYDKRLEEYHNGNNPYSKEKINHTIDELSRISIYNETNENESILDITKYIDSTLIKQISGIVV